MNKVKILCHICYSNFHIELDSKPEVMIQCKCILCTKCIKESAEKIKKQICPKCNIKIDLKKTINFTKPEQLKNYYYLFEDPELLFKKAFENLKVRIFYIKVPTNEFIKIHILSRKRNT